MPMSSEKSKSPVKAEPVKAEPAAKPVAVETAKPAAPEPEPEPEPEPAAPLLSTGSSSSPDVQTMASRRAHLVGALAAGTSRNDLADEIEAIDAQLAALGYKA
jgi:hypothetical protein